MNYYDAHVDNQECGEEEAHPRQLHGRQEENNAEVKQPLTASPTVVAEAVDDMYSTNGWTALWDGIRLGNELALEPLMTAFELENEHLTRGFLLLSIGRIGGDICCVRRNVRHIGCNG